MGFFGKIVKLGRSRILFDLLILFSIFLLPWWLSLVLVLAGIFSFSFYLEAAALALIFDLLYGPGNYPLIIPWSVLSVLIIFFGYQFFLKKNLRWSGGYD